MKYMLLVFSIFLLDAYCFPPKELKLTGERWYDWDGSAWIQRQRDDYLRDSLGVVTQMIRYSYNSSGTLTGSATYNRTDHEDYYSLSYGYTWTGYKQGGTYTWTHNYNIADLEISYVYNYFYWDMNGSGTENKTFTYTYENDRIKETDEVYNSTLEWNYGNYSYKTTFLYDDSGRVLSEIKQSLQNEQWTDKERTLWTYDGITGTGINEIYKNTVWIFQNKKTRTLNTGYDPYFENRNVWSWGSWIESETDNLYYNTAQDITQIITKTYDTATETYINYKRHDISYEDFNLLTSPVNFTSSASDGTITLSWDAVSGATGYNIYSSDDPYGTFEIDTMGTLNGTQWNSDASVSRKFYKVTATDEEK